MSDNIVKKDASESCCHYVVIKSPQQFSNSTSSEMRKHLNDFIDYNYEHEDDGYVCIAGIHMYTNFLHMNKVSNDVSLLHTKLKNISALYDSLEIIHRIRYISIDKVLETTFIKGEITHTETTSLKMLEELLLQSEKTPSEIYDTIKHTDGLSSCVAQIYSKEMTLIDALMNMLLKDDVFPTADRNLREVYVEELEKQRAAGILC